MNTNNQKGIIQWPVILVAAILLGIGVFVGRISNTSKPDFQENGATTTPSETSVPTVISNPESKGIISGSLIYPSDHIPEEMGVCAQRIDNPELTVCTNQIKDSRFQYGVGYELSLDPGNYYVYSFLGDTKAYYTEFVLCGLKAECESHTKIPVVVTAGSRQDSILPQDWYDISETPSPTITTTSPTPTVEPTAKPTSMIVPVVSIKLEKDMIKIIPINTPTPTPIPIVIPTLKVPKFEFNW